MSSRNYISPSDVYDGSSILASRGSINQLMPRSLPQSSASRRQVHSVSPNLCDEEKAVRLIKRLKIGIVMDDPLFTIYDKKNGSVSSKALLLEEAAPGFVYCLPSSSKIAGDLPNELYDDTLSRTKEMILSACAQSYGTVVFHGWDDVNSAPVFSVLLRIEPVSSNEADVLFFCNLYPGFQKMTADNYVEHIETVVSDFIGQDRICAVTSDNTRSCRNARTLYESAHEGLVRVNDQAHISDLFMKAMEKYCGLRRPSELLLL